MIPQQTAKQDSAAIVYIYSNYITKYTKDSASETLPFPPDISSYKKCDYFYKKNHQASENLLNWYKENSDLIATWRKVDNANNSDCEKRQKNISHFKSQEIRAAAAIAYIYADYLKVRPSETLLLPQDMPDNSSYEKYIEFYDQKLQDSEDVLKWFKKNINTIQEWYQDTESSYQTRRDNYFKRWKDVAKTELKQVVTLENIKERGVGKTSRIFNDNPIEEVLYLHEIPKILDNFLPATKEAGTMEIASYQMMTDLSDVFQQRFIQSNLLSEVIDTYQEDNPAEFQQFLVAAYLGAVPIKPVKDSDESDEKYRERTDNYQNNQKLYNYILTRPNVYTETLKKDLMSSFLQSLGNYAQEGDMFQGGEEGEQRAGKQIAYNKFQYTFLKNLEEQITNQEQKLDLAIENIQKNPRVFTFISEGETTEQVYVDTFLAQNDVEYDKFIKKQPLFERSLLERVSSAISTFFQSIGFAINYLMTGIKNTLFGAEKKQNNPVEPITLSQDTEPHEKTGQKQSFVYISSSLSKSSEKHQSQDNQAIQENSEKLILSSTNDSNHSDSTLKSRPNTIRTIESFPNHPQPRFQ